MKKRLLSIFLALCLSLSNLSIFATAFSITDEGSITESADGTWHVSTDRCYFRFNPQTNTIIDNTQYSYFCKALNINRRFGISLYS